MTLSYVIIHELDKKQNVTGATLNLYDEPENNVDLEVIGLVTDLNNRYRHRNEMYGVFDGRKPTDFHNGFRQYHDKPSLAKFIAFSKKAATALHKEIETIAPARGGYLVFARYREVKDYIGVFLVRDTTGKAFERPSKAPKTPKKLKIARVTHIDFENLAMACRINLEAFGKKKTRYLSFINRQSDEISQYFARWISTRDNETNEEDTGYLYELFSKVKMPIDQETGIELTKPDLFRKVYASIKATPGRAVNLRTLSEQFYQDAGYLSSVMEENNLPMNGEFKAHPRALKRFIEVHVEADEISLYFPPELLNDKIRFDDTNPDQIIINSPSLVKQLRDNI